VANSRDWKKEVLELRKSAEELRESHPDAALMRCRKAMEAIQYSIFEEKNGELPSSFLIYEKMMGKKTGIGDLVPKPQSIEFNTVHQWGNYGSHYQIDGKPATKVQVEHALAALDELIKWQFRQVTTTTKAVSVKITPKKYPIKLKSIFGLTRKGDIDIFHERIEKMGELRKEVVKKILSKEYHDDEEVIHLVARAIGLCGDESGWASLSNVGLMIRKLNPEFRVRSAGYGKLINMVRAYSDFFELKQHGKHSPPVWKVRNLGPNDS